jgi:DNA polymerase-4
MDARKSSGAQWPRVIAHADLDAFYASAEILDDPSLRGKPVIVGGSSTRGVVTSASYDARKYGVRAAMPTAAAQRLCPHGIFLRGRMARYAELSHQVRTVFYRFSPLVEPLSLDEAFLDLTGTGRLLGSPLDAGRALKRAVLDETGLVVSVGLAPTKMAAKILSDMSKPDGLMAVGPDDLAAFLEPLPVSRLWGVGRVTLSRLNQAGIYTIGDLARIDPAQLHSMFGLSGLHLYELAHGRDPREVNADWQRKSYGEENTFECDQLADSAAVRDCLIAHGEALGRRLRADGMTARTVTLKLKFARSLGEGRYPVITRSATLEHATDDGAVIGATAMRMLKRSRPTEKIRLVGIQAHNLKHADTSQLELFDPVTSLALQKRARLNRALDEVTRRFGSRAITRGLARAERAAPTTRIK